MKQRLAVGIDIGGTNTVFGVVDRRGNILEHDTISTRDYEDVNEYIDAIYKSLIPLIEKGEYSMKNIVGIGVGALNGNFYYGTIEFAPNLPWKGIIPLAKLLEEKFGVPVHVTNDANAAAQGEMNFGA